MSKIALIFPGQGSQSVCMGKELFESSDKAREIFNKANEILGYDLSEICFNGPEEELKKTIHTQPAILTVSIAALEALKEKTNLEVALVAGHSLGEYVAMYAAGSLDLASVLKLIAKRAELMNEAATKTSGTMAAILGLTKDKVESCLSDSSIDGIVSVANFNSPEQIVITGEIDAVNSAMEALKNEGAKRCIPLPVSGAFHSALMKNASSEFKEFVDAFTVLDATIPVITNVDAKITTSGKELQDKMPKQIYSSVYWTQTIQEMLKEEITTFIEIGPGKVLAGLNKKIDSTVTTYNVYDMSTLESTINALQTI